MILKKYIFLNYLTTFTNYKKKNLNKNQLILIYKIFYHSIIKIQPTNIIIKNKRLSQLINLAYFLNIKTNKFLKFKSLLNYYSVIHLQNYFNIIWNQNFCFRATNLLSFVRRYYKILKFKLKKTKMHPKLIFIYPKDVYNLFFCGFILKDVFLLQTWIKKQFERKSIKLYKSLIYTIWFLIKSFGWNYKKYNKIKSIFLSFKGKLIKGGSRKKLMEFSLGKLQSSCKTNKFISTSFVLRTMSGSVSCRLYFTFV